MLKFFSAIHELFKEILLITNKQKKNSAQKFK